MPKIPGIENANLFTVKTVVDIGRLYTFIKGGDVKKVTVVGGGFIGVEVAVNLVEARYQVALVEAAPQILNPYDYDMVQILHKEMLDKGVELIAGDKAASFEGSNITLGSGKVVEGDAYIIDVREENEYALSHIKTAKNIPLSQIRHRLEEIPKDRPVYLHCRSSQRSYNAVLALQAHGFKNVYNISGSYLGICFYEYFNDVTQKREPIVTDYNFN